MSRRGFLGKDANKPRAAGAEAPSRKSDWQVEARVADAITVEGAGLLASADEDWLACVGVNMWRATGWLAHQAPPDRSDATPQASAAAQGWPWLTPADHQGVLDAGLQAVFVPGARINIHLDGRRAVCWLAAHRRPILLDVVVRLVARDTSWTVLAEVDAHVREVLGNRHLLTLLVNHWTSMTPPPWPEGIAPSVQDVAAMTQDWDRVMALPDAHDDAWLPSPGTGALDALVEYVLVAEVGFLERAVAYRDAGISVGEAARWEAGVFGPAPATSALAALGALRS